MSDKTVADDAGTDDDDLGRCWKIAHVRTPSEEPLNIGLIYQLRILVG